MCNYLSISQLIKIDIQIDFAEVIGQFFNFFTLNYIFQGILNQPRFSGDFGQKHRFVNQCIGYVQSCSHIHIIYYFEENNHEWPRQTHEHTVLEEN